MKYLDAREYISTLRELTESGHEVNLLISGSSMHPFLIHMRDTVYFKKPDRELKKGDIVFYERENGQFVVHRICKVRRDGCYDIIGDGQREIEKGVKREQIFAIVTKVKRKGKWIKPGDFWWEFFARVWINVIPLRVIGTGFFRHIFGRLGT